jgi:hypothetical protein
MGKVFSQSESHVPPALPATSRTYWNSWLIALLTIRRLNTSGCVLVIGEVKERLDGQWAEVRCGTAKRRSVGVGYFILAMSLGFGFLR